MSEFKCLPHIMLRRNRKRRDYQIVGNTKDINTRISAIYHGCRRISVATVIYSSSGAHLSCDGEISRTRSGWRTRPLTSTFCKHTNAHCVEVHPHMDKRNNNGPKWSLIKFCENTETVSIRIIIYYNSFEMLLTVIFSKCEHLLHM